MRICFDTEFTGLHQRTTLISIGLVADDGRSFYAECIDYDQSQVDEWLRENVIKHLCYQGEGEIYQPSLIEQIPSLSKPAHFAIRGLRSTVAIALRLWLQDFERVEMWGDCLAYDWVLFCELFGGGAECLPRNVFYIPFDLCTLLKLKGLDPDISREKLAGPISGSRHNALYDAAVISLCVRNLLDVPVVAGGLPYYG